MYKKDHNNLLITIAVVPSQSSGIDYLMGGIIAFLILCYLIYTIARPEKF